jgi:hypothetical protein
MLLQAIGAPPRGSPKDFGTPVAQIDAPRDESIMPQYALRSDHHNDIFPTHAYQSYAENQG